MIVHDEETFEAALQMLATSPEGVRYSDRFAYVIVTTPETLEYLCSRALARNDIAIVVPRGHESEMEDYSRSLERVREKRERKEKTEVKEWIREHPEVVAKIKKKLK